MASKFWKLGIFGASVIAFKQRHNWMINIPEKSRIFIRAEELKDRKLVEPPQTPKYESDQCILVVGTTGTGKSSTIAKCTKQNVTVDSLADSVTKQCQIYPDSKCVANPVWIDTVGYDDSSKVDDDRTTPPQFFLPGSLTPADVTKWGSGCWKHCWEGFSGRCKLCGSTACR